MRLILTTLRIRVHCGEMTFSRTASHESRRNRIDLALVGARAELVMTILSEALATVTLQLIVQVSKLRTQHVGCKEDRRVQYSDADLTLDHSVTLG